MNFIKKSKTFGIKLQLVVAILIFTSKIQRFYAEYIKFFKEM